MLETVNDKIVNDNITHNKTGSVSPTPLSEDERLLMTAVVKHMQALQEDVFEMFPIAHRFGWRSKRHDQALIDREEIKKLYKKAYGKECPWVR